MLNSTGGFGCDMKHYTMPVTVNRHLESPTNNDNLITSIIGMQQVLQQQGRWLSRS